MAQSSDTLGDLPEGPRASVGSLGGVVLSSAWVDRFSAASEAVGSEGALSPTEVGGPGWGPGYLLFVSWPQRPGEGPQTSPCFRAAGAGDRMEALPAWCLLSDLH